MSIHAMTRCDRNRVPKDVGVGMLSRRFTTCTSRLLSGGRPITICYGDKEEDQGTTHLLDRGNFGICGLSGKFRD